MRHALSCAVVFFVASSGIAVAQPSSLPPNWTPSRAEMAAAWAAGGTRARAAQHAGPDSWEALRDVPPGTRIRVGYRDTGGVVGEVDGELIAWSAGAIQLGRKQPRPIAKGQVQSVWRLDPRHNRGEQQRRLTTIDVATNGRISLRAELARPPGLARAPVCSAAL